MACHLLRWLPFLSILSCLTTFPMAATPHKYKAVNLGGWLVTEGWITPSLFDHIPNKDFLDGTEVQFRSVTQNKYLSAEGGGGSTIVANKASPSDWETFKLWRITQSTFQFRVSTKETFIFIGLSKQDDKQVVATASNPGQLETFEIVVNVNKREHVRIKSVKTGLYLQVRSHDMVVTADHPESTSWEHDDPSVFVMAVKKMMQGEFQLTNGYGKEKATSVLKEHWSKFIQEKDFRFISENKLDAVRIPVGWWIASDRPEEPFVGGSLQFLDSAFEWAEKDNLKVIIDLHAAPGSQNGFDHSASRDGFVDWGTTEATIEQTVAVIEFLSSRYATRTSLAAIELLNEPKDVPLDKLKEYYRAAHNVVRRHTTKYVILSNLLTHDPTKLLPFARELDGSVIDVHYYNLYSDLFEHKTVQQQIEYVHIERAAELKRLTEKDGPLVFVGEWSASLPYDAKEEDIEKYVKAQLEVYGQATFGWAFWTFKTADDGTQRHWSLQWMIEHGHISL